MSTITRNADGSLTLDDGDERQVTAAGASPRAESEAVSAFFTAADEPVPEKVTNYQARQALIDAGLFDRVEAAVRASGNVSTVQAWDYANEFYRVSPFVAMLGAVLEMQAPQIDGLFRKAQRVA